MGFNFRRAPGLNQKAQDTKRKRRASTVKKRSLQVACGEVIEALEGRQLLSATSDGFTATFYGAYLNDVAYFAPGASYIMGIYSTHLDAVNASGSTLAAPPDAPSSFNPNPAAYGPSYNSSGHFSTTVSVIKSGYYTFYPQSDDGAQINLDGVPAGPMHLTYQPGGSNDTDPAPSEWLAGTTHMVDFYYTAGNKNWLFELNWSASSGPGGTGDSLITNSLMTSAGAPGVAEVQAPAPTIAPPVPTIASSNGNSITLTWSSHDIDAASYIVERSSDGGSTFQPVNLANPVPSTDGGVETYVDTGLSPNTAYQYKIVSNSITGLVSPGLASEPASSAEPFITQIGNSPLATPEISAAPSAGGNVLTIATASGITSYALLESSTLNGTYSPITTLTNPGSAKTMTYTDAGDNANSFYEVQESDGAGDSIISGPATLIHGEGFGASYYVGAFNGTTDATTETIFQPSSLAAIPTFSTIIPTINSGAQTASTAPAYVPASFNSGQSTGRGSQFSTEFDFSVVAPYTEQFTFLPRSKGGVQLTVDGTVIYGQGYGFSTYTDSAVVPVVWTAGSTHTVQMACANGGGGWEADLGWTSPTLAALNPAGFNGLNGQVVPRSDANPLGVAPAATPAMPPIADPPALTIGAYNLGTLNTTFNASEADSYNIYRGTSAGGEGAVPYAVVAGNPGVTPGIATYGFTDTNLDLSSTYYYYVQPVSASGAGAASNEISYTPALYVPAAPTNVVVSIGGTAFFPTSLTLGGQAPNLSPITVSWTAAASATSYDILRAPVVAGVAGTFTTVGSGVTSTSYVDNTASINAEYQYEVLARAAGNPIGASPGSTSAPSAIAHTDQGVLEEYYANSQTWGGASDNGDTQITGIVGNPNVSSEQANINFHDSSASDPPPGATQGSNYSTLFTGKIAITTGGTYTFFSNTDDDGILYVDGDLVASGNAGSGNATKNIGLVLTGGASYDFQLFQNQGGGPHGFALLYKGADSANTTTIVPQSSLAPFTGAPFAATITGQTFGLINGGFSTYPVTLKFNDNSDNELEYQLQRSTDAAFDVAGNVITVAASSFVANGAPHSGGAPVVVSASLTDPAAPQGQTFFYRVVATNFEGTTVSARKQVMIPVAGGESGVEANFFNNEWWRSTNQSTGAIASGGVGSAASTVALIADEQTVLPVLNGGGSDGGAGTLESGAANPEYPDPAGTMGPEYFSTAFTGQLAITTGGTYTFAADTDDDGYLYVDDKLVSSYPNIHAASGQSTNIPIVVSAGEHDFEFFESNGGGAWVFNMLYAGADTRSVGISGLTTVPASVLTSLSSPVVTPTNVIATPSTTFPELTLTWNNSSTSVIRYLIERSTDASFDSAGNVEVFDTGLGSMLGNPASYSFTDASVVAGTTYYYRVAEQNFDSISTFTVAVSVVAPSIPNATANFPTGFANSAGQLQLNGSAKLDGSAIELTDKSVGVGGSAFTISTISVDGFNTSFRFQLANTDADGMTFTLQGAPTASSSLGTFGGGLGYVGISQSVAVKFDLYNNSGEGNDSTGLFINGDFPSVPSNSQESSIDMTSSGIQLHSGDPMLANLSYDGVTLFEQVIDLSNGAVFTHSYKINIPSTLGASTGYVGFTGSTGLGSTVQDIQSWTYAPVTAVPYMPTNFTVTAASGTELDLNWADSLSTVSNYSVLELQNGSYVQFAQVAGTSTSYAVTGLNPGETDTFEVIAVNSAGASPPAGPVSGTTPVVHPIITVLSVTPEDAAGNGVVAGSAAKGQRSMETQIAVVFSQPVNLAAGAFALNLVNNYGSGANDGSPDTALTGVLGTPTNPSGDGMTWIIPILADGANSYALKGTNGGISGASLNNGIYQLSVVAADVTAQTGGLAMTADFSSAAWHRLFGDVDNAGRVFNAEYSAFLAAFSSTTVLNAGINYNEDLDIDGDGRVFNTDYSAFLADFGSTRFYSEPQS